MSALSAQLLHLQKQTEAEAQAEIEEMTLQDLENQVIMFGKTKMGWKFQVHQAFEDNQWTRFVVGRFEDSPIRSNACMCAMSN